MRPMQHLEPKHAAPVPARIIRQERDYLTARTADATEYLCAVVGRLRLEEADADARFPVIGDHVLLMPQNSRQAVITEIRPRTNRLVRRKAGKNTERQVLAANVDLALVVHALDGGRNFNLRRMERFLALTSSNRIPALLLLNKCDLAEQPDPFLREAEALFPETPTLLISAKTGEGLPALRQALDRAETAILLGPSGVGKSALINALLQQAVQRETAPREKDRRGRHTTTNRQMFQLPHGPWIIDTPGIREIQTWANLDNSDAFTDIDELAQSCRFRDCRHESEPGCAVLEALNSGFLSPERHRNYTEMRKQQDALAKSREESARITEKRNWKKRKYR